MGRHMACDTICVCEDEDGAPSDPFCRPDLTGIFRGHACWRCNDGAKPCAQGHPNRCDYSAREERLMGLDVTAYAKLSPASEPGADAAECRVWVSESPDFPGRAAPLTRGWYSSFGEIFGFRAGSYGDYGDWREWLARLAGYPPSHETPWDERRHTVAASEVHGGPFWELIYFSDCEGVIGSEVAAKLARDFREWDQRAQESAPDDWHYGQYARWRRAFEMAADGGAVEFA